jgi:replicative DNA helicase
MENNIVIGSPTHQKRILFHIFVSNFPKDIFELLDTHHFTNDKHKIIISIIKNYYSTYKELPNLKNVGEIILKKEDLPKVQKQALLDELSILNSDHIKLLNGLEKNDFEYVRDSCVGFIKTQELANLATQDITQIIKSGNFTNFSKLDERLRKIMTLGDTEDEPIDIDDFSETIFTQRYRDPMPTGLLEIDKIIKGLPRGKMGIFLAGQGVGKSTILINTSVSSFKDGRKVLHVIFGENSKEDVQLLVSTALTGIPFEDAKNDPKNAYKTAQDAIKNIKTTKKGLIKIWRFNSNEMTIPKLRTKIKNYEKKHGFEFDQINVDYVDEMISHLRGQSDQWAGEKDVVAAYLDLLVELDRSGWTATQAKKEANNKKVLEINDCGGSVAKIKKAQVVITIGRDADDRNNNRATFHLAKSNISPSGHIFENAVFDSSKMKFILPPPTGGTIVQEFNDDDIPDDETPTLSASNQTKIDEKIINGL